MGRNYPDTRGEFAGPPSEPKECTACQKLATAQVRVAWDYMRGSDDWEPVCKRHRKMAEHQSRRFIAHMMTKDRHFSKSGAA